MQTQRFAALATAGLLLFAVPSLASAKGSATNTVRKANTTVRNLLKQKVAPGSPAEKAFAKKLTRQVRSFLDIDELGRRALSSHWAKLTPAQRAEYLKLLRSLIEKNYIKGLRSNLKYKVKYIGETEKNLSRVVQTEIKTRRRGRPYTVSIDYVVRKQKGAWRAYDIVTQGVGLVVNYRAQFNRLISRKGFDNLLKLMRKKAAKMGS